MISHTAVLLRYRLFHPRREAIPLHMCPAKSIFPLINSGNLLAKTRNSWEDFSGRKEFDEDHPLPVVGSALNEQTTQHKWNHWDHYINPQITQSIRDLTPTPEYVGMRSGHNMIRMGWMKIGGSWKYSRGYNDRRRVFARGQWQERKMTPRFMLAPRVSPGGPRNRYEGKLVFSPLRLTKLLWAIDTGRLNPNEVITLYQLRQANVIAEREILWPGFVLISRGVTRVPYPIHIELQSASAESIRLIEEAGGSFTCTYMTHEGLYQELHPEEFPVFMDQELPDRRGLESHATNPAKRGWLVQWYEDSGKYAHPAAGRRYSHYVKPPTERDFPATVEEYEMVKHHQKWHLNQPGTGTLLPWHSYNTADLMKRASGRL
ncbi:putative Ribosomal proteins 50S L15 50S L18e 60S L27A [Trypanosoma vivax]|uniref:Large ribosomal subunit protein uL15/eL18 domain-containing protein n=1 Tax=Trypanosoma vivax (strain Y486) TaxID=1055687 RepID=G0TW26_TRYVY|nr:ribosomal protein L15 containing protein [Trypanosoma vivax]KAH8607124.1 putative Ribosomal proteins 50S L15 50S L18e 60S L27A [Trypanosoma vivax]KAH8610602.1 putative Ribosomal proteins 50S L15 50S L18e 60S L27A [Trypanosoma vivax]CCC48142.1 conserved hypothetical protein [Trypanosoma vivax Y486]